MVQRSGITLQQYIDAHGALSPPRAAAMFAHAFASLAKLHDIGVAHGALTLSSLVLADRDELCLASNDGAVSPPSRYWAPELLREPQATPASDLYAVGVCMLSALLGTPPVATSDLTKLLAAILEGEVALTGALRMRTPAELVSIIDVLLSPDPRARPASAADVAAALDSFASRATRAAAESYEERLRSALRRGDMARAIEAATEDRYAVTALLGQGGMGSVYRAQDLRLQREVAIKVMRDPHPAEAKRFRFHREARALGRLDHPAIVRVHEYSGREAALPFLVLELLEGTTLQNILTTTSLSEQEAVCVGSELAEALVVVHEAGLVHRDVTPANVFLEPSGRIVLGDFGIVRGLDADGATFSPRDTRPLGTAAFASPEQLAAPNTVGAASDVYSLASLLVALLTPGQANGEQEQSVPLGLPADASAELRELVGEMHCRIPEQRPRDVDVVRRLRNLAVGLDRRAVLRQFWERRVNQTTEDQPRGETSGPSLQPAKRVQGLRWGALVAALLVAAGLVVVYRQRTASEPAKAALSDPPLIAPKPVESEPSSQPVNPHSPTAGPKTVARPSRAKPHNPLASHVAPSDELAPPGVLRIVTKPWATVTIDGKIYGSTPLFHTHTLPAGSHLLRFDNPAYESQETRVDIHSGETTEVKVRLEKRYGSSSSAPISP